MAGLTDEQDLRMRVALDDLHATCFTPDMRLTLVARHPTEAERHIVITNDDLEPVAELIQSKITGEGK